MKEMKSKILLSAAAAVLATITSCLENDISYPKTQARITELSVEGAIDTRYYSATREVAVIFEEGADVSNVLVNSVAFTDGASVSQGNLEAGMYLDLRDTVKVTLSIYQDYVWSIYADFKAKPDKPGEPGDEYTTDGPQLYNMSFDNWTKEKSAWCPYGEGASDLDMMIWGTANKGTSILGEKNNTTTPEEEFLAVEGPGKRAAKLTAKLVFSKFASGNLFSGQFGKLIGFSGAELHWGVEFTARPKALHGYYCYQGQPINKVDAEHQELLNVADTGNIMVILADWDEPFTINTSAGQFLDTANDEHVIGFGQLKPQGVMEEYEEFIIPVTYRSDRTPKYIVIVGATSLYGDYFTGGEGSVLWLDEFELYY